MTHRLNVSVKHNHQVNANVIVHFQQLVDAANIVGSSIQDLGQDVVSAADRLGLAIEQHSNAISWLGSAALLSAAVVVLVQLFPQELRGGIFSALELGATNKALLLGAGVGFYMLWTVLANLNLALCQLSILELEAFRMQVPINIVVDPPATMRYAQVDKEIPGLKKGMHCSLVFQNSNVGYLELTEAVVTDDHVVLKFAGTRHSHYNGYLVFSWVPVRREYAMQLTF